MNLFKRIATIGTCASMALLAACGGGGGGGGSSSSSTAPTNVTSTATPQLQQTALQTPNLFLLFPNPQRQTDGSDQTNTAGYTDAYYRAVDPDNQRTTLAGFKAVNGFGSGTGTEFTVVFGDTRDLGYGRRMNIRQNPDGTMAFYVVNYQVTSASAYGYSSLNVEAAVNQDARWVLGINAIEFSPGPNGGVSFAKFYNFSPEGNRNTFATLDNRGGKAMPGPCIVCHGGRGDALTPPAADGNPLFNLVQNSASHTRGDVQAHLQPIELDVIAYSTQAGYTRADQEAKFKMMEKMVLCSYPVPYGTTSSAPEDQCRRPATRDEWQGTASILIKSMYGGDGLPLATAVDNYLPAAWQDAGQSDLYQNSFTASCRICHIQRGTGNQNDLDFTTYDKFLGYSDRIHAHVTNRGNMPDDELVFNAFYGTSAYQKMATFLSNAGYKAFDSKGAVLQPGRPVADPGPDRVWTGGQIPLSAGMSLYSATYKWAIVSAPAGASLDNPVSATPVLTAPADGLYTLTLTSANGTLVSDPATLNITVNSALPKDPATLRFADVKTIIQGTCVQCHKPGGGPLATPPVFYADYDRNGDGVVDATDTAWLYAEVRSRLNFTDIVASPLLRKPSNHHHFGGLQDGFDNSKVPGDPARVNYDVILDWILSGAPQ